MTEADINAIAQRVTELLAPRLEAAIAKQASRPERLGWSPTEAAMRLGIDRGTAYRWIDAGILPAARLGGRLIVSDAALRALLEEPRERGVA